MRKLQWSAADWARACATAALLLQPRPQTLQGGTGSGQSGRLSPLQLTMNPNAGSALATSS